MFFFFFMLHFCRRNSIQTFLEISLKRMFSEIKTRKCGSQKESGRLINNSGLTSSLATAVTNSGLSRWTKISANTFNHISQFNPKSCGLCTWPRKRKCEMLVNEVTLLSIFLSSLSLSHTHTTCKPFFLYQLVLSNH